MASIRTGIELNDNFSSVLYGIINSVNLAVSAMHDMSQTMNAGIDTSSLEGAREQLNQATIAADELNQALHDIGTPVNSPLQRAPVQQEPVQVPIQWQSDNLNVFNGTGVERFEQEIQSANNMLNTLNETQRRIGETALNLDIFPSDATQDIMQIGTRIRGIPAQIQRMEENPLDMNTGAANADLEHLRAQLNSAIQEQNNLNQAVQDMDVGAANNAYLRLSQTISSTERYIRDNIAGQEQFNETVNECNSRVNRVSNSFSAWQKGIIVANNALSLIENILGRLDIMNIDGAFNRLDTMNRFQKTITTMTGDANMAKAALEILKDTTLGTAYGLDVAAKSTQGFLTRGMSLGAATNQVRIWADAVSFYGEGTNQQLQSVVDAIGKMYSKGKVEADQLDRLFDAGIGAAEIYAQAIGESVSKVKDDLSNGNISSAQFIETVSQTLDNGISAGAAKNAGDTWATTFSNVQAAITRGWTNVITNLDSALASRGLPSAMEMVKGFGQKVESVLNSIGNSMGFVIECMMNIYEVMSSVGGFIADNWSVISPIVYAVVAALAMYAAYMGIVNAVELISNGIKIAMCIASYAHAAATGAEVSATAAATAAQYGLNTALLACPITWIILLVIALIAVLISVARYIANTGTVAQSTFGVICGWVAVAGAFILNTAIGLFNSIIQFAWSTFVEPFIGIVEWVLNVANGGFDSFGGAVANLIGQIISWFLSLGKVVTQIIDAIFGTDWTSGLNNLQNEVIAWGKNDNAITLDRNAPTIDYRMNYSDAYASGAKWGDGVSNKVKDAFSFERDDTSNKDKNIDDYKNQLANNNSLAAQTAAQTAANTGDTKKNTDKIAKQLDITSEDLKYLRDIAERDIVNRFTTAQIKVDMTNHNTINNDMDLDGVTEHLRTTIEEQMYAAAEGVH